MHERLLKRHSYKMRWRGAETTQTFTLIPDVFLDFRLKLPGGKERRMPVLLEHDRGTEGRDHFRRRIRAYIVLLKTENYKGLFGVKAVTVAFTTFIGQSRLKQMRTWAREELADTNEPKGIGMAFCFTTIVQPLDPRGLWLEPIWHTPYDEDATLSLLAD